MSSSVFYKFRSMKEPKTISFDGTGISVYELKRQILVAENLVANAPDFDFTIADESSQDPYTDDTVIVPRSSSVIASRKPAQLGNGKGRAARYVNGKAPVFARNSSRLEQNKVEEPQKTQAVAAPIDTSNMSEADRLQAMLAADSANWEAQQAQMATARPVFFKNPANRKHINSDKPLPPGYICHRCQEKGHWIQDCPTNDDPNFVAKPRLKRTTGIPKTFIKKFDRPEGATDESLAEDLASGKIMLDAAGNYVMVEADKATWEKFEAKHKAATAAQQEAASADSGNAELQELGLLCPIDKRLFVEPVKTPCCGKTYCSDCLENILLDNDLACPNCGETVLIDSFQPDKDTLTKIREYEREKNENPKPADPNSPKAINEAVATVAKDAVVVAKPTSSPTPSNGAAASKKRPAEDDLQKPKPSALTPNNVPKGPAAMQSANPNNLQSRMNMNGQNGFPMNMMGSMPMGMPGMPAFMPFMPMNGMNDMSGMNMNVMNGMMNMPMMPMNGGFPNNFNNNNNFNPNPMFNNNMMSQQQQQPQNPNFRQNQQQYGPNYRHFNQQPTDNSQSAYSRLPVNQRGYNGHHQQQNRAKRGRPSDYKSLT